MNKKTKGLILIFTGTGKGKTTAALGLALRAIGHKMRVLMIQFIKSARSGEHIAARLLQPELKILSLGRGFVYPERQEELKAHQQAAREALALAQKHMLSGDYQVLILDEIFPALSLGLLSLEDLLNFIEEKPPGLHLVLTGRGAPAEIAALADTVSEITEIKHAYSSGVPAQKGIEF